MKRILKTAGFFFLIAAVAGMASPAFSATMEFTAPGIEVQPGSAATCDKNFVVENPANQEAEIELILGNQQFTRERISANETKSYNLKENLSKAKMQGKPVNIDDHALILNISMNRGETEHLRIHCEE